MRISCPKCGNKVVVRSSRKFSPELRELYCKCGFCSARFKSMRYFKESIRPPAADREFAIEYVLSRLTKSTSQLGLDFG